jgi:polyhydroxyalkanoate synthesis repressor PhaR
MRGGAFQVVDSNSSEDLTRAILLQIMLEEESSGEPLFSAKMLCQLIRFYGGTVQGVFARYLEESLDLFDLQQQQLRDALGEDPLAAMTRLAQHNTQMWTDMQRILLRAVGFGADTRKDGEKIP